MPLQIYTNPNLGPALRFQGASMMAEGFGRGISMAGEGLAEALGRRREEDRRLLQNGKIADQIMRANPELLERLNMSADAFGSLSARDKAGAVQAVITSSTIEAALNEAAQTRAARERALKAPEFFQALAAGGQAPQNVPAPFSNAMFEELTETDPLRRIGAAARRSGFAPTVPEAADLIRAMTPPQNEIQVPELGVLRPIAGTGKAFVPTSVRGGQLIDLPAAPGPVMATPVLSNDKPTGWLRTPEGQYLREPGAQALESMDKDLIVGLQSNRSRASITLAKLRKLKEQGYTAADVDRQTGEVRAPSWLRDDRPIDELIAEQQAIVSDINRQLGGAQPQSPSTSLESNPEARRIKADLDAGKISIEEARKRILKLIE